jgi:four helix bundle protein
MGSASETQYLPLLARDLGYLTENSHSALERDVTEIKRMLAAFLQRLKSSSAAFRRDRAGQ